MAALISFANLATTVSEYPWLVLVRGRNDYGQKLRTRNSVCWAAALPPFGPKTHKAKKDAIWQVARSLTLRNLMRIRQEKRGGNHDTLRHFLPEMSHYI